MVGSCVTRENSIEEKGGSTCSWDSILISKNCRCYLDGPLCNQKRSTRSAWRVGGEKRAQICWKTLFLTTLPANSRVVLRNLAL